MAFRRTFRRLLCIFRRIASFRADLVWSYGLVYMGHGIEGSHPNSVYKGSLYCFSLLRLLDQRGSGLTTCVMMTVGFKMGGVRQNTKIDTAAGWKKQGGACMIDGEIANTV